MGYTQELHTAPETDDRPAWLTAAIDRRKQAEADEALKRRIEAKQAAETVNARLRELGITPFDAAHWTPGGYLVHARLIRPCRDVEDRGVTAGLHGGTVSVFVDRSDDQGSLSPALTKHVYVGPLNSVDDVLNAAYYGAPQQPPAPIDYEAEAVDYLKRAEGYEYGCDRERYYLDAAQAYATLAIRTDRATVADLRYRLAAIERLIAPVAASSPDETAALVGSAIHEIARGARTPEDALTLLPPDWASVLSGLTR